jgi:ribosomal protein S18 acetylase RimI-like enzyme
VVGTRVVVRRIVRGETGPSGGPALTDTLGTCTAWGGGRCVVEREDGTAVEIPLVDIVSGKPVPPRPSVRFRVAARDVERHSFADWPEVTRAPIGEWVVRSAPPMDGRLLKRANSALAMGDPGLPLADAAAQVVAAYERLGRTPLVQVDRDADLGRDLAALGWEPLGAGDSLTQVASVAQAVRRLPTPPSEAVSQEGPARLEVSLEGGAARGAASIDQDWLGVFSLEVEPARRRRGLARLVLAELLDWGASRGATTVWLHVEDDNGPALALYEGLGFRTHHRNRYLRV